MTIKMAALQPEEIIVNAKEGAHEEIEEKDDLSKADSGGPDSPDGVDALSPMDQTDADESDDSDDSDESGSESESEDDEEEEEEEAMPDGDTNDDLHALLQFSKSRLEKKPQPPPAAEPTPVEKDEEEGDDDEEEEDDENSEEVVGERNTNGEDADPEGKSPIDETLTINTAHLEEKKTDADLVAPQTAPSQTKDQAYYIEQAMKKSNVSSPNEKNLTSPKEMKVEDESDLLKLAEKKMKEAELKAKFDEDPDYMRKVAEKNVQRALAKAKENEKAQSENQSTPRPGLPPKAPTPKAPRDDNQELWALLNYSKRRLETGSTPQVKKKGAARDDASVSSKLSKSSKRSLNSKNSAKRAAAVSVEGGPGDAVTSPSVSGNAADASNEGLGKDAPIADVTGGGDGEDSVCDSVSLESGTKNLNEDESDDNNDEESSDEESSDEESSEEEEEDDLPDFLKDEGEDPEEAKMMYEAAKFKAASILSVSEQKLTDVQMLQAIAIAEEAASKGDEKFSTKRSLFKLNEAKVEDLKRFLSLSMPKSVQQQASVTKKEEVGWGIGRGRFMKKIGSVIRDFKDKCEEIDSKTEQAREGQPSNVEMFQAGMQDLKAQIDEYEKIVTAKKKQGKDAMNRSLRKN